MALRSSEIGGISAANGGMILVVEDDNRISRLERFVLEQVGYRVACAGTGEEALEMLPNTTPCWSCWMSCSRRWTGSPPARR